MTINHISFPSEIGFELEATQFKPTEKNGKIILINAAMAVEKSYYYKFAEYFANLGYYVYTYNYRGIGKTKPEKWKNYPIQLSDWFEKDFEVALNYILNNHSNDKKIIMGHSLGGQMIGGSSNIHQFDAGILVASGIGYWKNYSFPNNLKMLSYFYVLFPMLSHTFGYFPFSKVGGGEDLPKKVALEWAKWCRSKNYMFDFIDKAITDNYKKLKMPLLHYSFSDDTYCERKVALNLQKYYPSHIEDRFIKPEEIKAKQIGHFGFFKSQMKDTLWKELNQWLEKI